MLCLQPIALSFISTHKVKPGQPKIGGPFEVEPRFKDRYTCHSWHFTDSEGLFYFYNWLNWLNDTANGLNVCHPPRWDKKNERMKNVHYMITAINWNEPIGQPAFHGDTVNRGIAHFAGANNSNNNTDANGNGGFNLLDLAKVTPIIGNVLEFPSSVMSNSTTSTWSLNKPLRTAERVYINISNCPQNQSIFATFE